MTLRGQYYPIASIQAAKLVNLLSSGIRARATSQRTKPTTWQQCPESLVLPIDTLLSEHCFPYPSPSSTTPRACKVYSLAHLISVSCSRLPTSSYRSGAGILHLETSLAGSQLRRWASHPGRRPSTTNPGQGQRTYHPPPSSSLPRLWRTVPPSHSSLSTSEARIY
jgi:hypothetical protein